MIDDVRDVFENFSISICSEPPKVKKVKKTLKKLEKEILNSALRLACGQKDSLEVVKYLVSKGADPHSEGALLAAALEDNLEVVKYLHFLGVDLTSEIAGEAAADQCDSVVIFYLKSGGDMEEIRDCGWEGLWQGGPCPLCEQNNGSNGEICEFCSVWLEGKEEQLKMCSTCLLSRNKTTDPCFCNPKGVKKAELKKKKKYTNSDLKKIYNQEGDGKPIISAEKYAKE